MVPRTCINFLGLCRQGKYDGTVFHRLIPNFMIQGGRAPDGKDASSWGDLPFPDEFDDRLKHSGRGVLSMANSGPGTNRQQFFVTLKSCPHLDRKHSVFGKVVSSEPGTGLSVLDLWESTPVDKKDRPKKEIRIVRMEVLVDPALEAQQLEEERFERLAAERSAKKKSRGLGRPPAPLPVPARSEPVAAGTAPAVGRYLQDRLPPTSSSDSALPTTPAGRGAAAQNDDDDDAVTSSIQAGAAPPHRNQPRPPPPSKTTFGNFSDW
jgi:peptidyl-prolyl cis-trans isomerase-like protein 2